jgi:hypothetical protein
MMEDSAQLPHTERDVKITELNLTIPVSRNSVAPIKDAETGTFTIIVQSANYEMETIQNFV